MAKTNFLSWSQTAASNTDIDGIGIQGSNAVKNFDDALRTLMAQLRRDIDGKTVYASKSGNYTAVADDNNAVHRYTAAATVTLTAAATLAANWHYTVSADGGAVTIDPNSSETINGQTTLVIPNGSSAEIICDGSNFFTVIKPFSWEGIGYYTISAASSLNIANLSAYKRLKIGGTLSASVAGAIYFRTSTDNGATWAAGAADYSYQTLVSSGGSVAGITGNESAIAITRNSVTALSFETIIDNFSGGNCHFRSSVYSTLASGLTSELNGGQRNSSTGRNAIQLLPSGGTLSGYVVVEGVRG